jgi:hypothetical protein
LKGLGQAETESSAENHDDQEKDKDEVEQQDAEQQIEDEQQTPKNEDDVQEECSQLSSLAAEVEASEVIDPEQITAEIARLQSEATLLREENKLLLLEKNPVKLAMSEMTDVEGEQTREECGPSDSGAETKVPIAAEAIDEDARKSITSVQKDLDEAENEAKEKDQAYKADVSTPKHKLDVFQRKWLQSEMEEIRNKAGSVRLSPFQLNNSRRR